MPISPVRICPRGSGGDSGRVLSWESDDGVWGLDLTVSCHSVGLSMLGLFGLWFLIYVLIYLLTYLLTYLERVQAGEGQREREREKERIPSRFCTVSAEPHTGLEPTNRGIRT